LYADNGRGGSCCTVDDDDDDVGCDEHDEGSLVVVSETEGRVGADSVNFNAASKDDDDNEVEIGSSLPNDCVGATICVRRGGGVGSMIIGPVILS
jgi:hypothetical protein